MTNPLTYALWQNTENYQHYAVRLQDGRLTGIVGPLYGDDRADAKLPHHPYDDYLADLAWANRERRAGRWLETSSGRPPRPPGPPGRP
jgi:hypothetical protein